MCESCANIGHNTMPWIAMEYAHGLKGPRRGGEETLRIGFVQMDGQEIAEAFHMLHSSLCTGTQGFLRIRLMG